MNTRSRKWIVLTLLALAAGAGGFAWWKLRPAPLPPGFAMSNGRIEATQIDIATKLAGRVQDVLVNEGDFVESGQVVARMDTQVLDAELRQAQAQVSQARNAMATAQAVVDSARERADLRPEHAEALRGAGRERLRQPAEAGRRPHRDADGQSRRWSLRGPKSCRRSPPSKPHRRAWSASRPTSTTACSRRRAPAACSTGSPSPARCWRPAARW